MKRSAAHPVEQFHVFLRRFVPAEVLTHFSALQFPETCRVLVVQIQAALQRSQEIIAVVALEGKSETAFAVIVSKLPTPFTSKRRT